MTRGKVTIIGLGLIGGSLGLALKQGAGAAASAAPAPTISGWDLSPAARERAIALGAVDQVPDMLADAVADADLVVVAVPVLGVRGVFAAIAPVLHPGTVVTDVASTKALVCAWAAEIIPGRFVGGHPMAGSEQSGVEHARADLFAGATYCLTPDASTPGAALERARALVRTVGARPYLIDPQTHDRAVAAVSHLPFLLATALVEVTTDHPEWELFRALAASGFRDVSRLASGDPHMHRDICLTNAAAIRSWLTAVAESLQSLAGALDHAAPLLARFEHAKAARDAYLAQKSIEGEGQAE